MDEVFIFVGCCFIAFMGGLFVGANVENNTQYKECSQSRIIYMRDDVFICTKVK